MAANNKNYLTGITEGIYKMRLDTTVAKEKIVKFMLDLYDSEFGPYAKEKDLWFFNSTLQLWLSPNQMREQIAAGRCDLSKLHQWEYVGPYNLSKHAQDRIEYWYRVKLESEEEAKKTAA